MASKSHSDNPKPRIGLETCQEARKKTLPPPTPALVLRPEEDSRGPSIQTILELDEGQPHSWNW